MTTIEVETDGDERFEVVVRERGGETRHTVTMNGATYARLAPGGTTSRVAVIRAVFAFLLDREPKESILRRFDVTVVGRYFPEFERQRGRYLSS
ncbi:MAG: hypothetical protein SF182_23525 [Deltaproteobacteria bacterium]|nr:hypothetical protein [Deltaproteobacteria bacterium]